MGRTHDTVISNFDLDRLESQLEHAERERDEALAYADKLAAGLPEGMLPKDVEVLRDANLALAVERDALQEQLDAERALADRLAEALKQCREDSAELLGERAHDDWSPEEIKTLMRERDEALCEYLRPIDEALAAWKEARSE